MPQRASFRAYGKCLLAGGYSILYPNQFGLVKEMPHFFKGIATLPTNEPSNKQSVTVSTAQFPPGINKYTASSKLIGGVKKWSIDNPNPYILSAISKTMKLIKFDKDIAVDVWQTKGFIRNEYIGNKIWSSESPISLSQPHEFYEIKSSLHLLKKTGLGSSACLTTSIVGALVELLLPEASKINKLKLINLIAQLAHNKAQGNIGSGFDVSCAVYGDQIFERFSPERLKNLQNRLAHMDVNARTTFEHIRAPKPFTFPGKVFLLEYSTGTDTIFSAKKVVNYLDRNPGFKEQFLARSNNLVQQISEVTDDYKQLKAVCNEYRALQRELGKYTQVGIEPQLASDILDLLLEDNRIIYAVCPGSGGYDALALVAADGVSREEIDQLLQEIELKIKKKWPVGSNLNIIE